MTAVSSFSSFRFRSETGYQIVSAGYQIASVFMFFLSRLPMPVTLPMPVAVSRMYTSLQNPHKISELIAVYWNVNGCVRRQSTDTSLDRSLFKWNI